MPIKFESYVRSPLTLATTMLHKVSSAMTFEQVKEQYSLSFDPFESFGEYGFYIVLTPRTDLQDESAPLFGYGWDKWEDNYSNWIDWVEGIEPIDEGAEDNYAEGI